MTSRPPATEGHPTLQRVLTCLTDEDCRRILTTISEPMSASEIAEACEIPLSTTYRKLHLLSEASLVGERLDVSTQGKHTTRYVCDFDRVTVGIDDGGFEVTVASDVENATSGFPSRWQQITQQS
ncbi:MAG: helix-turn-helix domain-containing protein [Halanaeroarchaeum sp.]